MLTTDIDAEWCLHYQEAFLFWHRAYLRYVEELIDFPIPYWNGFASDTSNSTSNYAGLPSVFLDETYVHPNGQTRPNPLRYALSLNGTNKMGTGKYIERAQVLIDGPKNPAWSSKIALFDTYHQQIKLALKQPFYSIAQHILPWANLPAFTDHQPDSDYPRGAKVNYFDGHFEQPHDNYHGWIGPDMVSAIKVRIRRLANEISIGGQLVHGFRSYLPQLPRQHGPDIRDVFAC